MTLRERVADILRPDCELWKDPYGCSQYCMREEEGEVCACIDNAGEIIALVLEEAAKVIVDNTIQYGSGPAKLVPRNPDDKSGLEYAAAIRSLIPPQEDGR
jgi:hypothetical protein